jgi:ammonia channel protein AmtB
MSIVVMTWVYPTIVAWIWGGGWLIDGGGWLGDIDKEVVDFGGAGPIHIMGGAIGLVGTLYLRPRIGYFSKLEPLVFVRNRCIKIKVGPDTFKWSNSMLAIAGGIFVWLGLCFVNAATADDMNKAGQGFLNSFVAGSSASFFALIIRTNDDKTITTHFSALIFGMVSGVVSVSSSC